MEAPVRNLGNRVVWIVGFSALLSACGSGNPAAPSIPQPPSQPATVTLSGRVTATNGGQALPGLQAALGATTSQTDGSGSFSASLLPTATLQLVLTGSGIVPRTLTVAAMSTRTVAVDAIAQDGRFDLNFYRQFVRDATESPTLQPLRRWTQNPSIYLQTNGLADARTLDMVEAVARDSVPRWTAGQFNVATVERGPGTRAGQAGWLTVLFSTDTTYCGLSDVGRSGGTITLYPLRTSCACGGYQIRPTGIRHEFGHAMGLYHTDNVGDVMYRVANQCDMPLSAREVYHAAIAYSRPVGNQDPDTDSAVTVNLAPMRVVQ